ncbi:MAG: hypothetical protein RLZZ338_3220 [Cyanobacteriota bacterium]|jgi:S-DNA-T family DNA segregation ATPase FtsK/SpoIIIE
MFYLTNANDIQGAITKLTAAKTLWVDTEVADWQTPNPRLSLIQVLANPNDLTGDFAYILDVLDQPELVEYFVNLIMVNPRIEKVFHNSGYDLKYLGKKQAQNVTCTWKISQNLSLEILQSPNRKLKTLAAVLCQFSNINQEEQTSDWGERPLTQKQLDYAKMDTVYLAGVHRRLLELTNQNHLIVKGNTSMPPAKKSQIASFSVTKVRVAFECPRLFYLGHHVGGMTMFLPQNNPHKLGNKFHYLADLCAFLAKQDPRFKALFEPEVEQLKVDEIAAQMQQLFYELAFFPHLQTTIKTAPEKAQGLFLMWQGLKGLIHRWAELITRNRHHCNAKEVIGKTLLDLKPSVKHYFHLPNGTQQLVQGRFDSLVYDFEQHRLCVVEYKTYQSPDKSGQLAQVALYCYMLREKMGVQINSAVYSTLPDWHELTFTWDELENTVNQLIPHKLQQMQEWIAWEPRQLNPPPPTSQPDLLCGICPQQKKCQSFFEVSSNQSTLTSTLAIPEVSNQGAQVEKVKPPIEAVKPQKPVTEKPVKHTNAEADAIGKQLVTTLQSFGIGVDYLGAAVGPAFIRVKLKPHLGIKVVSLLNRSADLQVQMGISSLPLIAPQPGYVSVDLPRYDRQIARFDDYIQKQIMAVELPVRIAIGINLEGELVEANLSDPNTCHFLVGGTTGSGKSEFLRSLLLSLLYRYSPKHLKIALVDPKRVTFSEFEEIPWLFSPIVKEHDRAIELMTNLVTEMESRYRQFESANCVDITSYNQKSVKLLPRIVCIFDEYADFMAEKETRNELELSIKRLGAMARAAGIHLIIATQRPEAKVVTPLIRSNLPGRVALRTASEADSTIVLGNNQKAAAYLLGKGDLFYQVGSDLHRLQSLFADSFELL